MDKENVILFSLKKGERHPAICNNMDKLGRHANLNNSRHRRQLLCDANYMKNLK